MQELGINPNPRPVVVAKICDRCQTRHEDTMEMQEFLSWSDTCGYGNFTFGDLSEISIDLCQYCTKEVLGEWIHQRNPMSNEELIEILDAQKHEGEWDDHYAPSVTLDGAWLKSQFQPVIDIFKKTFGGK